MADRETSVGDKRPAQARDDKGRSKDRPQVGRRGYDDRSLKPERPDSDRLRSGRFLTK